MVKWIPLKQNISITNDWSFITPRFNQTKATNYANFCVCIHLHSFCAVFCNFFSRKNQYFNKRNECKRMQQLQRKTTPGTTGMIKERQFRMTNKNCFCSRILTGQTRRSSCCGRYIRPSVVYVTLWS